MAKRGRPRHPDILTPREWEVLELLREGLTNPQIAERLGISLAGARYHVSEILGKLGVRSREEAAGWSVSGEGRRPWWTAAAAPLAFVWRRAGALPFGLSSAAMAVSGGLIVASLAGLGLMAFLAVRGGDSSPQESAVVAPTVTATATAVPIPTPRRTGIDEIDRIIDALFSGDPEAVRPYIRYTTIACVKEVRGLGGPPKCLPGEAGGTLVEVFSQAQCEGHWGRPETEDRIAKSLTVADRVLYGVYDGRDRFGSSNDYAVVFFTEGLLGPRASMISIDDGGIVYVDWGCAERPEDLVELWGLTNAVLPPLPSPESPSIAPER